MVSAHTGYSSEIFPHILALHVSQGASVADVTYGKGVFWKNVDRNAYELLASDLKTGTDCRRLPYSDGSVDAVVLDPPYMEGLYRAVGSFAGNGTHGAFRTHYSNGICPADIAATGHAAVLELYVAAAKEARRVLKSRGVLIVKCQDEVSGGRQHLTHVEIISRYAELGYVVKDLFVLVRQGRPVAVRVLKQRHARKNHSYFLVFQLRET